MTSVSVEEIPSVAAIQILSFLDWNGKLNAIKAINAWKPYLYTTAAWPIVNYRLESEENIYFVKEKRTNLLICIKLFGRFMKHIQLEFWYKVGRSGLQILHSISENCPLLQDFSFSQGTSNDGREELIWKKSTIQAVCSILSHCQHLSQVGLLSPVIDWSSPVDNNILHGIIEANLTGKVTNLELTTNSVIEHENYLRLLTQFSNLKKLTVRREKINDKILLTLVRQGLQELTLYQDEELPLSEFRQFNQQLWDSILKLCPTFKVDLVLKYIMVIKDSFPPKMPLRSLVLDDLVNIVTKGVMDYLVANYQSTLESFTYTNSYLESFESGDRRMPSALVMMVTKCTKLHTVQYGFPLSSTTILLLAKVKKLHKLVIPSVEVTYEFDWPLQDNWTPAYVEWLQRNGQSEKSLENAVSELIGFPWHLSYESLSLTLDSDLNWVGSL